MDGASGFKKEANVDGWKICILLFGQQEPPKLAVNMESFMPFI